MRPGFRLNKPRRALLALGLLTLMVPASAYALTAASSNALAGSARVGSAPRFALAPDRIDSGDTVTVTGRAPRSDAGRLLAFEFARPHAG